MNTKTTPNPLPRLVASDIGGTLLRGGNTLPAFTTRVLNRLTERDVPVALITGYNRNTTMRYTANLSAKTMLLPQNGTMCFKGKEKIWEYRIQPEEAEEIYGYLVQNNLPTVIYKGKEGNFMNYFTGPPDFTLSEAFKRIETLTDFDAVTGISTLVPNQIALSIKAQLERMIGNKFQLIYVKEEDASWLEILQSQVRKDLALKRLCDELAIPPSEVIYFGDNFNDLEALRLVGRPVVVKNAVSPLKDEFKQVIGSVAEEGVGLYLNQLYKLNIPLNVKK